MFPWILVRISFILICSLILRNTPLTAGLIVLSTALCISISYASFLSSWFALLIFLIYIGGILVIFSYFVALTPNQEKFTIPTILFIPLFITIFIPVALSRSPCFSFFNHSLIHLYSPLNSTILILLALLLFLTIVIIVKITNLSKGPLRAFNYV